MRILRELWEMVSGVLVSTFVEPVRDGRPRPSTWPRGLPAIGAAALIIYFLLALAALFAVPLRQSFTLVLSQTTMISLPEPSIWLLQCGVILSFALIHTAALHTSWWLRIVLFLLGSSALYYSTAHAFAHRAWIVVGVVLVLYVGLIVFTIIRARRTFAWWEFVVVTTIVSIIMLGPAVMTRGDIAQHLITIEGTFSSLAVLTFPALLVAGAAPAQIVVTASVAVAKRPVIRPLLWALALLGVGWLSVSTVFDLLAGSDDLNLNAVLASAIMVIIIIVAIAALLARGGKRTPDEPSTFPDAWTSWLYPLAFVIVSVLIILIPVTLVLEMLRSFGPASLVGAVDTIYNFMMTGNTGVYWRAGMGVVLLVIAWRINTRGRTTEAILLTVLSTATILQALSVIPTLGFLHERNTQVTALIAAGAALIIGGVLLARRALDRERATWIVTVILLACLYPFRDFLDDPAGAALFFSASLLLLFGLTWRILSGSDFLQGDSRLFPQSTRVLVFIANSLFAVTSIAFVALARATATSADSSEWGNLGDWVFGEPLFIAALVTALWLAARKPSVSG